MKAMILAAGLGTRLKPITDKIPKALVKVDGIPMLQRVILKLKSQGFNYIVVNVHHFTEQIIDFLSKKDFGIEIVISDESDALLDTGGGIIKARNLLFKYDNNPFLVHNVDILSNGDLDEIEKGIMGGACLLVSNRPSGRKLIFDEGMTLRGWHNLDNGAYRPAEFQLKKGDIELAFSGIYSMSRRGVEEMERLLGYGKFSVMDYFLHPDRKERIQGMEQKGLKLIDIGKPATLSRASEILKELSTEY